MATLERAFPSAETARCAGSCGGRRSSASHSRSRWSVRWLSRSSPPATRTSSRAARALGDDRRRRARPLRERVRGRLRLDAAEDGSAGRTRRPRRLLGLCVRGAAAGHAGPRAAALPPLLPSRPEQHHRQLPAQSLARLPRWNAHLGRPRRSTRVARLRRREEGSILIVSDLEILPDEVARLSHVIADVRRDGMEVRILPVNPSDEKRALMEEILGKGAFLKEKAEEAAPKAAPERRACGSLHRGGSCSPPASPSCCSPPTSGCSDVWRCGDEVAALACSRHWPCSACRSRCCSCSSPPTCCASATPSLRTMSASRPSHLASGLFDDPGFLPGQLASKAVGLEDDLRYRRAVSLYARANPSNTTCTSHPRRRRCGRASSRSSSTPAGRRPIRGGAPGCSTSWASWRSAATPSTPRPLHTVRAAIDSFTNAINTDPTNADAKFDLEIVLRDFFHQVAPASSRTAAGWAGTSPASAATAPVTDGSDVLTPMAAIFAVSALLPLGIYWFRERRAGRIRSALGLEEPSLRSRHARRRGRGSAPSARDRCRAAGPWHRALGAGADGRRGVLRHGHVALDARRRRAGRRHQVRPGSRGRLGHPRPYPQVRSGSCP